MKEDFWGFKNTKDSLSIDIKETRKSIVKGAVTLAIGIPLLLGLTNLINGSS